jgi:hypothetical protein
MADGVAITAGSGTTISTDDAGASGHVQRVKLTYSADGSATHIDADANGLLVNLGTNNDVTVTSGTVTANLAAGTNNIGDVDVLSIAAGTNYVGRVRLTDGTNDTSVSSTGALFIGGAVAHDGLDSGNPVKLGHRAVAFGATPTAVAAADRSDWLATRAGIPFSLGGHPNIVSAEYYTTAAQTDDPVVATVAAGTKIIVTGISVACSAANTVNVDVRIGFGTSTLTARGASGADGVAKIILSHPGIAPGSGMVRGGAGGIIGIGADDEDLRITCSAPTTGALTVQVDYFTIAG